MNLTRAGTLSGEKNAAHPDGEGGWMTEPAPTGWNQQGALNNFNTLNTAPPGSMVNVSGFGTMTAEQAVNTMFGFDKTNQNVTYQNNSVAPYQAPQQQSPDTEPDDDGGTTTVTKVLNSIFSNKSPAMMPPADPPTYDEGNGVDALPMQNPFTKNLKGVKVTKAMLDEDKFAVNSTVPYKTFRRRGSIFADTAPGSRLG